MARKNIKANTSLSPGTYKYAPVSKYLWQINTEFNCCIAFGSDELLNYTIKIGYRTNFRSGPKFLNIIVNKIGSIELATCWLIHDVNYEGYLLSQLGADKLLYYMLLEAQIEERNCQLVYIGLRLVGFFNYVDTRNNRYVDFEYTYKGRSIYSTNVSSFALPVPQKILFSGINSSIINSEDELIFEKDFSEYVYGELANSGEFSNVENLRQSIENFYLNNH